MFVVQLRHSGTPAVWSVLTDARSQAGQDCRTLQGLPLRTVGNGGRLTRGVQFGSQLLNDQPEPLNFCMGVGEGGALGRERTHHPLQVFDVVRQVGQIDPCGINLRRLARLLTELRRSESLSGRISRRLRVAIVAPAHASRHPRAAMTTAQSSSKASHRARCSAATERPRARGAW